MYINKKVKDSADSYNIWIELIDHGYTKDLSCRRYVGFSRTTPPPFVRAYEALQKCFTSKRLRLTKKNLAYFVRSTVNHRILSHNFKAISFYHNS